MAEPSLEDVLDAAAGWSARRVVVQPHLLFGGVLLDRIRDGRRSMPSSSAHRVAADEHLGPSRTWLERSSSVRWSSSIRLSALHELPAWHDRRNCGAAFVEPGADSTDHSLRSRRLGAMSGNIVKPP